MASRSTAGWFVFAIALAAVSGYLLYRRRGTAVGRDEVPALDQERLVDEALMDSFPASDPPAFSGRR